MAKTALRAALGLLVVTGIGACSSNAKKPASTAPGGAQSTVQASDAQQFSPLTLTITAGQMVTWTNGGTINHTVTFDSGPAFDQPLNPGKNVTRAFTAAGTFAYHCSIHGQSMHGTIVVK
jgi:plastocyanin